MFSNKQKISVLSQFSINEKWESGINVVLASADGECFSLMFPLSTKGNFQLGPVMCEGQWPTGHIVTIENKEPTAVGFKLSDYQ